MSLSKKSSNFFGTCSKVELRYARAPDRTYAAE